jgi:hypothetical protein
VEYKGLTIEIQQDEDAESPRSWDNIGKMVCFHKRYSLGDEHGFRHDDYSGWDEMQAAIEKSVRDEGDEVAVILPIYMYDHSGLTINTTGFSCPWDSGRIGFIYVTKGQVRKEYKRCTQKALGKAKDLLLGEVEAYDQYLRGDVYGYTVTDPEGKMDAESCWGFFGHEYCEQEAKAVADSMLARKAG